MFAIVRVHLSPRGCQVHFMVNNKGNLDVKVEDEVRPIFRANNALGSRHSAHRQKISQQQKNENKNKISRKRLNRWSIFDFVIYNKFANTPNPTQPNHEPTSQSPTAALTCSTEALVKLHHLSDQAVATVRVWMDVTGCARVWPSPQSTTYLLTLAAPRAFI